MMKMNFKVIYYFMNNLMKLGVNKFYEDNKDKNENYKK